MKTDVCVIGGGPSGSITAGMLAKFGHSVVLVESQTFPREHVAATIHANVMPRLEMVGITEEIHKAGFLNSRGITVSWETNNSEFRPHHGSKHIHVERAVFDNILLEFAAEYGAQILQPAKAGRVKKDGNNGWVVPIRHSNQTGQVSAKIVVDASAGRRIPYGKRLRQTPKSLALYAYYPMKNASNYSPAIEALPEGWMWSTYVSENQFLIAFIVDPNSLTGCSSTALFSRLVDESKQLHNHITNSGFSDVKTCDASMWVASPPAGTNFFRVGDACLQLDPLSSQGVTQAVSSAIMAAIAVNTQISIPDRSQNAIDFYNDKHSVIAKRHLQIVRHQYRKAFARFDTLFWRERSIGEIEDQVNLRTSTLRNNMLLNFSKETEIRNTPVIREKYIHTEPAFNHPMLDEAVAFIGGLEVKEICNAINGASLASEIVKNLRSYCSEASANNILQWLWTNRIIDPV